MTPSTDDFAEYYRAYSAAFDQARDGLDLEKLHALLEWLEETRQRGAHLFVLGNGGSAASASHWACDFGKGVNVGESVRFRVLAPADLTSWYTALGNDVSFADTLGEQLRNWLRPGDLVVALSVSGDSENLVRAFHVGRRVGARLVAIVGAREGRLRELADLAIVIPSTDYGVVEDMHMMCNHVLSQWIHDHSLPVVGTQGMP